jgi:hypothetical protein
MVNLKEQLAEREYIEALARPKVDAGIERLVNKYGGIMTEYHVTTLDKLKDIIERAYNERLDMIIQREYCGYVVEVWKG